MGNPTLPLHRSHTSNTHLQKSFISRSNSSPGDTHLHKSFISRRHSSPVVIHLQETLISRRHSSPQVIHLQKTLISSSHSSPGDIQSSLSSDNPNIHLQTKLHSHLKQIFTTTIFSNPKGFQEKKSSSQRYPDSFCHPLFEY